MGKATASEIIEPAQQLLDKLGVLADGLDSRRARNGAMARAKKAMKGCLSELNHRVIYAEPTQRSLPEIESAFDSALTQWNKHAPEEEAL